MKQIEKENVLMDDRISKMLDSNYEPEPNSGCWLWMGSVTWNGYAEAALRFGERTKHIRMSRLSYRRFKGDIPKGLLVLHKCDNRICINPDHLELGTHEDNAQQMVVRGRDIWHLGEHRQQFNERSRNPRSICCRILMRNRGQFRPGIWRWECPKCGLSMGSLLNPMPRSRR